MSKEILEIRNYLILKHRKIGKSSIITKKWLDEWTQRILKIKSNERKEKLKKIFNIYKK